MFIPILSLSLSLSCLFLPLSLVAVVETHVEDDTAVLISIISILVRSLLFCPNFKTSGVYSLMKVTPLPAQGVPCQKIIHISGVFHSIPLESFKCLAEVLSLIQHIMDSQKAMVQAESTRQKISQ